MSPRARSPWQRRSRRVAYANEWITVHHDEVVRPDGAPGIYGVVHFAHQAVGVVVLDGDRVLLVGQHRYPLDRWSWEIPEGGAAADEDPLLGAQRELAEETGYRAASWQPLVAFSLSNSVTDEMGRLYLARDVTPGAAQPDGTERLDVRWVPFAEAMAMIERGEIHDAMTIVGLQAVALRGEVSLRKDSR